jgi:hypothetical protein
MFWRGPENNCGEKALMDDIEGTLVVVSLYVDGGWRRGVRSERSV